MAKDWDQFEKFFKKFQPKLKGITDDTAFKIQDKLLAALNEAWDHEDDLVDVVKKAVEDGEKSTKVADFMGNKEFSKSHKKWKKSVGEHKKQIKSLSGFTGNALKKRDELKKKYFAMVKSVKKSKEPDAAKKKINELLKKAEAELNKLEEVSAIYGTLKMPELFYAAKEDKTMEIIVKKTAKKASGKDLPKILEEKAGAKNVKNAENMKKVIEDQWKAAADAAGDPKEKDKKVKLAKATLDKLKKLNESYQKASKKQDKEIKAAENSKKLLEIIKKINDCFVDAEKSSKKHEKDLK